MLQFLSIFRSPPTINQLYVSIQNGRLEEVNGLLKTPEILAQVTAEDNKALREAAQRGHLAIVNRLLEIPAVRDQATARDNEALRYAAFNSHLDTVNRLLEIPAVLAQVTARNNYVLTFTAHRNHLGIVNRFLAIPAVLAEVTAGNNEALRGAASSGNLDILNRLLEIPEVLAQVTAQDRFGNDALRRVASCGGDKIAIVNRLLEIPAVLAQVTADNNKTLRLAASCGNLAIVNRLLEIPAVKASREDILNIFDQVETTRRPELINRFIIAVIDAEEIEAQRAALLSLSSEAVPAILPSSSATAAPILHLAPKTEKILLQPDDPKETEDLFKAIRKCDVDKVKKLLKDPYFYAQSPLIQQALNMAKKEAAFPKLSPEQIIKMKEIIQSLESCLENLSVDILSRSAARIGAQIQNWSAAAPEGSINKRASASHEYLITTLLSKIPASSRVKTREKAKEVLKGFQKWLAARFMEEQIGVIRVGEGGATHGKIMEVPLIEGGKIVIEAGKKRVEGGGEHYPIVVDPKTLTPEVRQLYLRNIFHTAWRYLQNPNPFMSEKADRQWVIGNPLNGTGYAAIREEDLILLADLWLTADYLIFPSPGGHFPTKEAYLEELANTVASIGRAHNLDKFKKVDDMDGDNPSCHLGVRNRLMRMLEQYFALVPLTALNLLGVVKETFHNPLRKMIEVTTKELSLDAIKTFIENLDIYVSALGDLESIDDPKAKEWIQKLEEVFSSKVLHRQLLGECWRIFGYDAIQNQKLKWDVENNGKPFENAEKMIDYVLNGAVIRFFYQTIKQQLEAQFAVLSQEAEGEKAKAKSSKPC